ncbi:MAG TPA: ubiquinol-cytochrome c reductase iron-sulfur subunit [Anaerolineales bacterium]|jgi:Rieske Fe-S protein
MSSEQRVERRGFLGLLTWGIGGLITALYGIPAVAYLLAPALERAQEQVWIRLGSIDKVELGVPTLFKTTIERTSGWITDREELSVYVITNDGREFTALSNVCTHLGCRVRWIPDREEFFCPCHNGVFDRSGAVVSGPPPRALDAYEVQVEDDQISILGS